MIKKWLLNLDISVFLCKSSISSVLSTEDNKVIWFAMAFLEKDLKCNNVLDIFSGSVSEFAVQVILGSTHNISFLINDTTGWVLTKYYCYLCMIDKFEHLSLYYNIFLLYSLQIPWIYSASFSSL